MDKKTAPLFFLLFISLTFAGRIASAQNGLGDEEAQSDPGFVHWANNLTPDEVRELRGRSTEEHWVKYMDYKDGKPWVRETTGRQVVLSIFGVMGGGNSNYSRVTDGGGFTGRTITREVDTGVDNPFGPGDIFRAVTTPITSSPESREYGLGNGFFGGGGVAVDMYYDSCDDDDCDEDCEQGFGSEVQGLGGENDSAVLFDSYYNYSIRVHEQDRLVFSAGVGAMVASHFADPVGVLDIRYTHQISGDWGSFVGVEGAFGGDTSLGEVKFGFSYTFGK